MDGHCRELHGIARRLSSRQCERERDKACQDSRGLCVDDQDTVLTMPDQKSGPTSSR
jgi:hypothetical protein